MTLRVRRGRPKKMSCDTTLKDIGISRDQSAKWQRLASIPEEQFEAMLKDPSRKPTTEGLLREAGKGYKRRKSIPCPHCGGTGKVASEG